MSGYNEILELGTPRSHTSVSAKSMPLPEAETLRDRFAMAAIQGFCSQCDATGMWSWKPSDAAEFAYQVADAMMEARK